MADDDDWRRRMADERYGDSLIPGFARHPPDPSARPAAATFAPDPSARARDVASVTLAAAPRPAAAAPRFAATAAAPPVPPSARASLRTLWWTVAGIVLVLLAAAIGWFARRPAETIAPAMHPAPPLVAPAPPQTQSPPAQISPPAQPAPVAVTPPAAAPGDQPPVAAPPAIVPAAPAHHHTAAHPRRPDTADRVDNPPPPRSDRSKPSQATAGASRGHPSFTCRAGQGAVTHAICGDRELAALDRRLAARFAALDASVDPATIEALHHGETTFLNERQLCRDRACLVDSYRVRLRELEAIKP